MVTRVTGRKDFMKGRGDMQIFHTGFVCLF